MPDGAGLPKIIMDGVQVTAWVVGAVGGVIAAFRATHEMREARKWKMSNAAKELIDDLYDDTRAFIAIAMLDWDGRNHAKDENTSYQITWDEMLAALRIDNLNFTPREGFVRDCFDALYFHLSRIGQAEKNRLIDMAGVSDALKYVVGLIEKDSAIHHRFMNEYGFESASGFVRKLARQEGLRDH